MAWPVDEFTVTDPTTGLEQIVSISLPVRHAGLDEMPLLVCLDGPWVFGTVRDATRIMSMGGEAPEAAVVGLSFSDRSMGEYLRQRARWYTPTPWVPPEITGVKGIEAHECGRAAEYLAVIQDTDPAPGRGRASRWDTGLAAMADRPQLQRPVRAADPVRGPDRLRPVAAGQPVDLVGRPGGPGRGSGLRRGKRRSSGRPLRLLRITGGGGEPGPAVPDGWQRR